MKEKISDTVNNLKLEICTIFIYIIVFLLGRVVPNKYVCKVDFLSYFGQDRLNGIAAFFAITIGVYITVVTVLATSELEISKEMLMKRLDRPLINIIVCGMIENLLTVGFSIFIPLNEMSVRVLVVFLTISIISFSKFIILLVTIFKINLEKMAEAIDEKEQYKNDILVCTEEIRRHLREHKRNM